METTEIMSIIIVLLFIVIIIWSVYDSKKLKENDKEV